MKNPANFPNVWEKAALAIIGVVNLALLCSLIHGIVRQQGFA